MNRNTINQLPVSKTLSLWCISIFVISWGISFYLWYEIELDKYIIFNLNHTNFNPVMISINQMASQFGMAVIVFIYLVYLILSLNKPEMRDGNKIFLLILISFAVAGITGEILKEVFNRTRPVYEFASELKVLSNPSTPSFPSGHATKSMALVIPFLVFALYHGPIPRLAKIILALLAFFVCFSRIFLGAHYLSDVLAAVGWAVLMLPLSIMLSNRVVKKMTENDLEKAAKKGLILYIGLTLALAIV